MQSGTGVYQGGKSGGYARVHICHHELTDILNVCLVLDDHEWNDQLRDGSFASWTDAAIAGAQYALKVADQNSGEWVVHRIVGLTVDTNPRFVTIAAARSVWNLLGIEPSPTQNEDLGRFASTNFTD